MNKVFRALLFTMAGLAGAGAAERDVVRRFAVQPGCALRVDTHRGRVVVEEGDTTEIVLTLAMDVGLGEADAKRAFDAVQLETTAAGNVVQIRLRNPADRTLWIWEENKQIEFSFKFTVPRRCDVDLTVGNGSVTVGNVAGRHRAQVRAGDVFFRRIDGSVDVKVETGLTVVSRCSGPVTARAKVGAIRIGTVGGMVQAKTGDGEIDVLAARAGAMLEAEAGSIVVGLPEAATGDIRATADGGSVVARIEPGAGCRIEAAASWGRVESKVPVAVEAGALGSRKLTAVVGSGGPTLTLRASGGGVRIEKLEFDVELTESAAKSGQDGE